mgnify:FL=1
MNSKNARSAAHASEAGVRIAPGWPGIEYDDIQHIQAPEPDDHVSRLARAHAECCMNERAQALELAREVEPKASPRVPRNTEPCPLWVAGLIAVGVGGGALLGAAALGWVVYQVVIWIGGVL